MQLQIESTDTMTMLRGQPVRLWRGTTPGGRSCDVFVAAVGSADAVAQAELEVGLLPCASPPEAMPLSEIMATRPGG
jgi:hypothetical protein